MTPARLKKVPCGTAQTGPVPLREVLTREGFLQQFSALLEDERFPSREQVAKATAFLAEDRAKRQGDLL